jgi:hypothetical protein
MIEVVLNALTEHDFQGAFKNGRSTRNGAHSRKGPILRVMASRPKVSFDQMVARVPEIMDVYLYFDINRSLS